MQDLGFNIYQLTSHALELVSVEDLLKNTPEMGQADLVLARKNLGSVVIGADQDVSRTPIVKPSRRKIHPSPSQLYAHRTAFHAAAHSARRL